MPHLAHLAGLWERFTPSWLTSARQVRLVATAERAATGPAEPAVDSLTEARAHKQQVRAAATRRVAGLALLFLTCDEGPTARDTETELVTAAWSAARAALGHQHFVHTQPATFADVRALATT